MLGFPQDYKITPQTVSPCVLAHKQRAKNKSKDQLRTDDVRLIVNVNEVSQHMKTLPSKTTTIPDVWIVLGKFKVLIVSDLYQGFFQNHLHPSSRQWLAVMSPFGGLRIFLRSVQGLLNQTEELDELLSKVLAQELKEGIVARIADNIIVRLLHHLL